MIRSLSRQEKMDILECRIHPNISPPLDSHPEPANPLVHLPPIVIAKQSPTPNHSITHIAQLHQAPQFEAHLKQYLNSFLAHQLGRRRLEQADLPVDKIDVFPQFRFRPTSLHDEGNKSNTVKALPSTGGQKKGRFDTVVVMDTENAEATGLEGIFYILSYLGLNTQVHL
jgi:hypothetical protein